MNARAHATAGAVWHEAVLLGRLEFVPEKWRVSAGFGLRTWAATMLSLYVAYFLQLDQPYWAAMAVWMVAQPTPGMAISKSFYRIIGTLAGSVMGVVLIALFAQTPELFILALALWIGGCTVGSNLLRNFRAYGTVLAGYTAAIIALGSYSTPDQIFTIAMARGSATIIGVLCAAMVTSLFAPHRALETVRAKIRQAMSETARRCLLPETVALDERIKVGKPLLESLIALDADIEYAAGESAQFRIHADGARSLVAHLFGVVSARRSIEGHLLRAGHPQDTETAAVLAEAATLLGTVRERMEAGHWEELNREFLAFRVKLRKMAPEDSKLALRDAAASRLIIDRLADLFRHYERAVHDWGWLHKGWRWEPSLTLNFHRDQRLAWINGARGFVGVILAGIIWVATAWPSGAIMLTQVTIACSLFSTAPRPEKAGADFFWGGLLAAVGAFICNYYVLVNISGFSMLAMVYLVFLMPGAIAFLNPRYSLVGLAYCVIFIAVSRPLNPMDYDIVSFLNNALATQAGVAMGVLMYLLVLPPDRLAARRYVVRRIRKGLRNISRIEPVPVPADWQTRMYDRVSRLHDPLNPSGSPTDEWFEGGLGSLNLGNDILRLRMLLREGSMTPLLAAPARSVIEAFRDVLDHPAGVQGVVTASLEKLRQIDPGPEAAHRRAWLRAVGDLEEMAGFFVDHPRFLTPN